MAEKSLTVSFGGVHPARIEHVRSLTWEQLAKWLTATPPEHTDKAARGWYCPAEFDPAYRDSENFVARHALTFDFDHVEQDTWARVDEVWGGLAYAQYTTWSHCEEYPRFRVVIPLSRPTGYDEFQAVARKVATDIGIELVARESFMPAQMMYAPTVKPGGAFQGHVNEGDWLDVDAVLAEYDDWTDRAQWPTRRDGDGVHQLAGGQTRPDEKPGIVGDFCRAFTVPAAIERFELPYKPTATPDRWTYTAGSRPEGAIVYDDGLKFHSHHDTDPARGQNNAFDLVRLHRFGKLDGDEHRDLPVTQRPSYRAMCELALAQPELRSARAAVEFDDLGPLVEEEVIVQTDGKERVRFLVQEAVEFSGGPPLRWIVKGVLPRAEVAVIFGDSGAGKSFLALDLSSAITRGVRWRDKKTEKGRVVYVAAEGAGGFRARLRAYAKAHAVDLRELPAVIADAPNMLDPKDAAAITKAILDWGRPDVIVIDTLAAASPGGNENSGEDMGTVLSHCKLMHEKTGALVVLIHHSGKDASKGARGWSGLRAAADAEIEVTRNGDYRAAKVTKLKDGADGAQWPFRLKPVVLGIDPDGEEETSCVIEHTDEQPASLLVRQKPSGKYEPIVYEVLKIMAVGGTSVDQDDLLQAAARKLAKEDNGRDMRKRNAKRGLDGLIAKKLAHMHEGRVSLTSVPAGTDEEFDERLSA